LGNGSAHPCGDDEFAVRALAMTAPRYFRTRSGGAGGTREMGCRDELHLAAIVQNLKTLANHFWRPWLNISEGCSDLCPRRSVWCAGQTTDLWKFPALLGSKRVGYGGARGYARSRGLAGQSSGLIPRAAAMIKVKSETGIGLGEFGQPYYQR
jgi:hypothetical protein